MERQQHKSQHLDFYQNDGGGCGSTNGGRSGDSSLDECLKFLEKHLNEGMLDGEELVTTTFGNE